MNCSAVLIAWTVLHSTLYDQLTPDVRMLIPGKFESRFLKWITQDLFGSLLERWACGSVAPNELMYTKFLLPPTIFSLIEAMSQIQAGSLIEAGV